MITIKMLTTGEVHSVTPNVAHGLVEAGEAEIVTQDKKWYETREMRTSPTKPVSGAKKPTKPTDRSSSTRSASKTYKSK